MVRITDKKRLFLILSRPAPLTGSGLDLAFQDIDSEALYRFSLSNQVGGFVFQNLNTVGRCQDKLKKDLGAFYKNTALKNMVALKELLTAINCLNQKDIPVVPLKGVFAADTVLNDFGVYPSGDIDILVPENRLWDAKEALCEQGGYIPSQDISQEDLVSDHYHLILIKRAVLEVHWNLVKRYFTIPADFWWESARPMSWNKVWVYDLSAENQILYHSFRLFNHCFYPLRFFVLLGAIIDRHAEQIDWELVLTTADAFQMKKLVLFSLYLTHDLLGTRIPKSCIPLPGAGYRIFRSWVLSGIFSGVRHKHFKMMLYTALLIHPQRLGKIFLARLFPSKGELRMRYNLPKGSKKIYLYYIFNPILLFLRSEKKETHA